MSLRKSSKLIILLLIILALVVGGYSLFIWFIINIMRGDAAYGLLFVALIAGIASFFNPCSFPILPAYLAQYFSTKDTKDLSNQRRMLLYGLLAALGVITFNILLGSLIGLLGVGFGKSLALAGEDPSLIVRWVRGIVGALLFLLGFSHITGRGIHFGAIERFVRKNFPRNLRSPGLQIFTYGFAYTLLGIGCGGPILAGLSVFALSQGGFLDAFLAFLIYSFVMALLMLLLSSLIAFSKQTLIKDLKANLLLIKKVSGILLMTVGLFLILSSIYITTFTEVLFP